MFTPREGRPEEGTPVPGKGVFAPARRSPGIQETGRLRGCGTGTNTMPVASRWRSTRRRGRSKFSRGLSPPTWGSPSTPRCARDRWRAVLAWPSAPPSSEEYIYKDGLMINSSYGNYRIPTFRKRCRSAQNSNPFLRPTLFPTAPGDRRASAKEP